MSMVLEFVQVIVLYGAYELTRAAMAQFLSKCGITNFLRPKKKELPKKNVEELIDMVSLEHLDYFVAERKSSHREIDINHVMSEADVAHGNTGPICPPQSSMMKLARNSYFS